MTTQRTRTRPAPAMTAYQRSLYASHDNWRAPAEIGASATAKSKTLDTVVVCAKCESAMELRRVTAHRRECFGEEMRWKS